MRTQTAIIINCNNNIPNLPKELNLIYYKAETREILEKIDFFRNPEIKIVKRKDKTYFSFRYKNCIDFLESLKTFSKSDKNRFEEFWFSNNPIEDADKIVEYMIIMLEKNDARILSTMTVSEKLNEKVKKILDKYSVKTISEA